MITLGAPCCLVALEKNRLAAAISRRLLKRKSKVRPCFIDGAIQVDPLAFDFDVGFIHTPGVADWPCVMIPALFKLRDILLQPPQNGRMGQGDATLGHHSDEIAGAELKRQIPSDAQDDDFLVKSAAL